LITPQYGKPKTIGQNAQRQNNSIAEEKTKSKMGGRQQSVTGRNIKPCVGDLYPTVERSGRTQRIIVLSAIPKIATYMEQYRPIFI